MSVSSTYDERYGSDTREAPPGNYDAPEFFGTIYQLAEGVSNSAFGAINPPYGVTLDIDLYGLGSLSSGRYKLYATPKSGAGFPAASGQIKIRKLNFMVEPHSKAQALRAL